MVSNGHTAPSSAPVGYITGGVSGLGLAVAEAFSLKGWNLTLVDINEASIEGVRGKFDTERTIFIKANVTDYGSQGKALLQTWEKWHRLDLVFANAGIADSINLYAPATDAHPNLPGIPAPLDELTLDIDLNAAVSSAYLALHFFRQNASKAGKIVFTSSICGLYPSDSVPLYTAAKHGLVGLTRAMSRRLQRLGEPITVNCICPGLVDSGLTQDLMAVTPPEYVTPVSTIVRAMLGFVEDDTQSGRVAECSGENIYYREQPAWGDERSEYVMTNKLEAELVKRGKKAGA